MGKKEDKAFKVLVETAAKELAKATQACGSIASEEDGVRCDKACHAAEAYLADACVLDDVPSEVEKRLEANSIEISALRIRAWENWQMIWREQQAVADPTGKYAVMRAEREALTAALQDGADDGNGHHSPKP